MRGPQAAGDVVQPFLVAVDQDPAAGMQAFMSGKIKVQGDLTKLMTLLSATPESAAATAAAFVNRVKAITA